jgi:aminoglycoside/choline kinase family phosphotransferase
VTQHIVIADTPGALTPAWLTTVLRAAGLLGAASVVTADQRPVGTGQMCDSVRLTLQFDGLTSAPASMIAKLPAADPTSRETAKTLRSYENEVRFYQQLAPGLPIRTPVVYHADIDVETASFILLLEDMAPAQQGDQLTGCSADVAKIAVDELVHLHAPRWNDPALADIEWLHRDRPAQQEFLLMLLPALWAGFCDRYDARLDPAVRQAGGALFGALPSHFAAEAGPSTIVHGDYRLDNLLFDPSPGGVPVTVVDWQTCTHGPALNDVAYFIGAGLLPDVRRDVEDDLVRGYHAKLIAAGVTDYSWDACWHDYRRGTWAGLIMAVAASMLVEQTERGDQMFLTMATRHSLHALEMDAIALLGA